MEVFMSQSQLYKSYCQYSADVHEASFLRPNKNSESLSEVEFLRHWESLSSQEKEHWQTRFALGYAQVQTNEFSSISAALFRQERKNAA